MNYILFESLFCEHLKDFVQSLTFYFIIIYNILNEEVECFVQIQFSYFISFYHYILDIIHSTLSMGHKRSWFTQKGCPPLWEHGF
jgi:hypothetical protein